LKSWVYFFGERFIDAAGDWQLARFKTDPANKGKVFRAGLWRYTPHPNYLGEATFWCGYFFAGYRHGVVDDIQSHADELPADSRLRRINAREIPQG
jgi:steroid 5-alpha reductase family enzyme